MIGVQINKNVIISKIERAGSKKELEITFTEIKDKTPNFFEQSAGTGKSSVDSSEATVRVWPLKAPTFKKRNSNEELDPQEKLKNINSSLISTKNALIHILERYMTTDQAQLDAYRGTEINGDNYEEKWLDGDISLGAMFDNLCEQFMHLMSPFVGDKTLLSRLKLVRQAKDKSFAVFPSALFINDGDAPFYEPMDVPEEATRVKFTKYEIDNGLATETPGKETADSTAVATPEKAKSVFGGRK